MFESFVVVLIWVTALLSGSALVSISEVTLCGPG